MDAPEIVVRELGRGRRLERGYAIPLRAEPHEDRADHPVLAGGVQTLQNEEQATGPLCVQALLKDVESLVQGTELFPGFRLVEAESIAGVALRDPRRRAGLDSEVG